MLENNIKKDFPIFDEYPELAYLDNAATSQKPKAVVEAISNYYSRYNANVHRGIYELSEKSTELFESARKKTAGFIGAASPLEIVFTKGTTESLNRIAVEWAMENLTKGDEIITTNVEHHSNLVPWQIVAARTKATLTVLDCASPNNNILETFKTAITKETKLIAVTHASNVLGMIFPIKEICKLAKTVNAKVAVDGAQAVPHIPVNVQSLGCDFYAFSGHKMLGPMGTGVLWAKKELLDQMPPYEYGGGMITTVTEKDATWAETPHKFEAGTPNIAGAVGLATAVDYLTNIGMENIQKHDQELMSYATKKLSEVDRVTIIGTKDPQKRVGIIPFTLEGLHPHDIATVLSTQNVAVRAGLHCAMPLHNSLGLASGSVRASFYLYNNKKDVDKLIGGLEKVVEIL